MEIYCVWDPKDWREGSQKRFEEFKVFMKGYINYSLFESGSDDAAGEGTKLMKGLEVLLEIVTTFENGKSLISSQIPSKRIETGKEQKHSEMLLLTCSQLHY